MDIECQRGTNDELERTLEDLKKQQAIADKELQNYFDEIARCYSAVNKKQREIEVLNKKLDKIKASGVKAFPLSFCVKKKKINEINLFYHRKWLRVRTNWKSVH